MIPILYETTETTFTTNGIGRLSDAVSCTVTEVRNGEYELEMEYPITGIHYSDIELTRLILAIPADGKNAQPFEIYDISRPLNGIVTIYARHISYRLNKITVGAFTAATCAAAMNGLKTNSIGTNPFDFWTDKVVSATFTVDTPSQIRGLLGGQEGSILDVFGKADYEFDRFLVKLHQNRGTDSGVTLLYGKNITALTNEADTSSVYTGIVPFYFSNGTLVTLPSPVYGDHRGDYPYDMVVPVDLTSKFENTVPTQAQIRTAAQSYMQKSEGWKINTNIKVSFVNLADTEEYKDIAGLQRVNLCDTVTVHHEALGVNATAQVVKTVYNVLLERYDSIELGAVSATLGQAITESIQEVVPTFSAMEQAIKNGTDLITGNSGGYVVLKKNANGKPEELLVMDTEDINTATKVWRFNNSGLGYSNTGYNGTYRQAWTIDGAFYTDWVTAGRMTANIITAGTLKGFNDNVLFDLDAGTLTLKNKALRILAGNFQLDADGNVEMTGTVTATGGKIGSFNIGTGIYSRKTSLMSNDNGVYIGTDGVSFGKHGNIPAFMVEAGGDVSVSYLYFRNQNGTRSQYGLWSSSEDPRITSGGAIKVNTEEQQENYLGGLTEITPKNSGSDRRIKKHVEDLEIEKSLRVIGELRPVSFEFKEAWGVDGVHHGFIAQEVEKIADWDIVKEVQDVKVLNYQELIPDIVRVLQYQQKEIMELKARLSMVEVENNG